MKPLELPGIQALDLLDVDPRDRTSNDQLLDLARAFKDGEDL